MSSSFPSNEHDMLRASYKKLRASTCNNCKAPVQWWQTTHGKNMPFNPTAASGAVELHRCPNRPAAVESSPEQVLVKRLGFMRMTQHARVIVMIDKDGGTLAAWAKDIPAEDLRNDLISAANFVRAEVLKEGK